MNVNEQRCEPYYFSRTRTRTNTIPYETKQVLRGEVGAHCAIRWPVGREGGAARAFAYCGVWYIQATRRGRRPVNEHVVANGGDPVFLRDQSPPAWWSTRSKGALRLQPTTGWLPSLWRAHRCLLLCAGAGPGAALGKNSGVNGRVKVLPSAVSE